jgi:hypothetical protein
VRQVGDVLGDVRAGSCQRKRGELFA